MSETRLRELLADLVADVNSPSMAQQAWRAGRQSRRHRMLAGAALATLLVVGGGVAVVGSGLVRGETPTGPDVAVRIHESGPIASSPAASAPVRAQPRVQTGPDRNKVGDLPVLRSRLAALSQLPASAEALSADPVSQIAAAAQRTNGHVLVLGRDGAWRDAGGGASLLSTSISPDARWLVLAQGSGLTLIDATTGRSRALAVPDKVGRVDNLLWLPGGKSLAVSGDGGAAVVSAADGSAADTTDRVHDLTVGGLADQAVQLTPSELVVRQAGTTTRHAYTIDARTGSVQWAGAGWLQDRRAARTGWVDGGEQAVLVVDVTTAAVTHMLNLPAGAPPATRSNGCCATLGWLDSNTVLLRDGGQVLAWNVSSGALSRVATLPGTTRQGADPGYDTAIAIAQS